MTITMLRHNKVDLALHILRDGTGTPLLVLHGLGEASPTAVPHWAQQWGGPVAALDFTGHGQSTVPPGGGYTANGLSVAASVDNVTGVNGDDPHWTVTASYDLGGGLTVEAGTNYTQDVMVGATMAL